MRHAMLLRGMGLALIASACTGGPTTPLARAAAADDADTVRQILKDGTPPDHTATGGITALMIAARAGAVSAMTALLDSGADPNARDTRMGWTVLMHAVHKQQAG